MSSKGLSIKEILANLAGIAGSRMDVAGQSVWDVPIHDHFGSEIVIELQKFIRANGYPKPSGRRLRDWVAQMGFPKDAIRSYVEESFLEILGTSKSDRPVMEFGIGDLDEILGKLWDKMFWTRMDLSMDDSVDKWVNAHS